MICATSSRDREIEKPIDTLRCYAYRDKDGYYAVCLDLLLIVRRDTIDEAINELQRVITGYLEDAYVEGGWDEDLLPRPAPLED
jgi:predicted RNase H-like HicB family nuclease